LPRGRRSGVFSIGVGRRLATDGHNPCRNLAEQIDDDTARGANGNLPTASLGACRRRVHEVGVPGNRVIHEQEPQRLAVVINHIDSKPTFAVGSITRGKIDNPAEYRRTHQRRL